MAIVEGRRKERRELVMMTCNATGSPKKCQLDSFRLQLVHECLAKTGGSWSPKTGPGSALQQPGAQMDPLLSASIIIHRHDIELHAAPLKTSAITASPRSIKMKDESKPSGFITFFALLLDEFC